MWKACRKVGKWEWISVLAHLASPAHLDCGVLVVAQGSVCALVNIVVQVATARAQQRRYMTAGTNSVLAHPGSCQQACTGSCSTDRTAGGISALSHPGPCQQVCPMSGSKGLVAAQSSSTPLCRMQSGTIMDADWNAWGTAKTANLQLPLCAAPARSQQLS